MNVDTERRAREEEVLGQPFTKNKKATGKWTMARKLAAAALVVPAVGLLAAAPATAEPTPPEKAYMLCEDATFWANYNHATGQPEGYIRTLRYGNKVGHTRGAHPVYNGWAASFDYGPNDWGYMRFDCIGAYGSWS